ncbi:DNA methylase [Dolichospermum sp. UHCC 0352]|uniref:DNA methylase n=1 Tax=Dolichospermum sp. UHCC 0352 TaxID=2590011 RepID=UPI0014480AAE|nr:DNA methylase [Dolichospermum sp. UHCC 0352]MTJ21250.1 DNA methylase [Dolichospermum sp. UHCC 0352]
MVNTQLTTPWDYCQSWEDGSCSYDGHTITWKHQTIIVTNYIKQKYLSPDWYFKKLTEHWELIGFIALFLSDGTTASTQELSQALKLNLSVVDNAVELGFSIGWFEVNEKVSLIFLEEKCDNSIYVQESEQVLELPDSVQVGNLWESARTITTVQTSSVNDSPVILSEWYDIPPSWLDPLESRPATALLENKDRQQEIFLIPELPPSELTEFNTLQLSPGSITTEKFLEKNLDTEELNQETSLTEKFLEESSSTDKSNACGCLYQYIENKKLKNGTIVSYPRVEGERDKHNYLHWRWGYSWEEKIDGQWKNRSLGVSTKIVTQVANMIYNGNSVQNIREFIALSKNYRKSDK